MNARGWRLAAVTALATTLIGAALLLISYVVARNAVVVGGHADPEGALGELRRQFIGWSLLLLPTLYFGGRALGRALARQLHAVRRTLVQHAHTTVTENHLESSPLRELREIGGGVALMHTELTRRAAGIESQRSTLSVLVDSVNEGLLRVDGHGRIVFANPECRALLELLPSALGQTYAAVVRNSELRVIIRRALDGERVSGAELAFGERRMLVSAQPIAVDRTAVDAGVVLAFADLTALRRLEGVRRDFVANVSHELKTPLTSIRGYSETLLQDDAVPDEVRRQFLTVIHKNADRLQQIVDDLLDLSRIESGGWRPELQQLNAAELVRDVWQSCHELAERRRVHFQAPDEAPPVLADPGALRQILTNLFENALRYTADDGLIEVRISHVGHRARNGGSHARRFTSFVQFEVRDNGTGIPRDALPRIFERFYRVDPARSRAEGGTGLGLSIVKHLVESMGGTVSAQSELGKGTTLRFTLPSSQ